MTGDAERSMGLSSIGAFIRAPLCNSRLLLCSGKPFLCREYKVCGLDCPKRHNCSKQYVLGGLFVISFSFARPHIIVSTP